MRLVVVLVAMVEIRGSNKDEEDGEKASTAPFWRMMVTRAKERHITNAGFCIITIIVLVGDDGCGGRCRRLVVIFFLDGLAVMYLFYYLQRFGATVLAHSEGMLYRGKELADSSSIVS